jgi:peptide-methionine (R)-S-oxide reductase
MNAKAGWTDSGPEKGRQPMSRTQLNLGGFLVVACFIAVFTVTPARGQDTPSQDSNPGVNPSSGGDAGGGSQAEKSRAGSVKAGRADERSKAKSEPVCVRKSDAEWRRILTRSQYAVTRQKATEPAFSGKYATGHYRGTFVCVCCGATLFDARTKFDSGTGWPSFYRPATDMAIQTAADYDLSEPRVEVMCRRCGAHLGHVFDDGPPPTGWRFCINSIAIKNVPPDGAAATVGRPAATKAQSPTKSKSAARNKSKTAASSKTRSKSTAPKPAQSTDLERAPATETDSGATKDAAPAAQPPRASDN